MEYKKSNENSNYGLMDDNNVQVASITASIGSDGGLNFSLSVSDPKSFHANSEIAIEQITTLLTESVAQAKTYLDN